MEGITMFSATTSKQSVAFQSACERFAATHVLSEVARETGIREQVLRNKLNADQPHKLTVEEMIAIYHATGDETLLDGALFDCGLTAVKLPDGEAKPHLVASAVEINANVAGIGMHALEVTQSGRVTKGQRNTIVSAATIAMGQLAIIISEVEHKFQTVPAVGCCVDALRTIAGA
jgi:predicted transcriptional regulator